MDGFWCQCFNQFKKTVELKSKCFFLTVARLKLRPTRGGWAWSWSPAPSSVGAWPVKPQKSLQISVFCLKCESVQLTDTVCWTSDLCEYCCAQCCTIRSTAASILVLLQYVQSCSMLMFLSVWPPGGAATVCMPSRSFQVNGLFAAVAGRSQCVNKRKSPGCFPLQSLGKRLCAALIIPINHSFQLFAACPS